jgi:hypothetical protein
VIKDRLDDVRLHAEVGHARGCGATQIVQRPMLEWFAGFGNAGVEFKLGGIPASKPGVVAAEYMRSAVHTKLIQYCFSIITQRDGMVALILGAGRGQRDLFVVNLIPAKESNLALALPG